jgi:hypothetical protein
MYAPTEFRNLSCGEVISKFVDKCGEYGMLVMLDNHRLDEQNIPDLVSPPHRPLRRRINVSSESRAAREPVQRTLCGRDPAQGTWP